MNTFVALTLLTGLHQEHNMLTLNFILVHYQTLSHLKDFLVLCILLKVCSLQ